MIACSFDESNTVLGRPREECGSEVECLSVCRTETVDGTPVVISCWKLTAEELAEINRTGRVWLLVVGETMPPVALNGLRPFADESGSMEG